MSTSFVGELGEVRAAAFLENKGYRVLTRNVWRRWGEIDIVARGRDGCLVFVEVKTMVGVLSEPERNYTWDKERKMQRAVRMYVQEHPSLIYEHAGIRIDLIAVQIIFDEQGKDDPIFTISHYENIRIAS